jgi:hypothetical protein
MTDDRTVHAETGYAEVVRYDRAGVWYVEDKQPIGSLFHRARMPIREVVEWLVEQPTNEVKVYYGKPGGRQFDKRVREALAAIDE